MGQLYPALGLIPIGKRFVYNAMQFLSSFVLQCFKVNQVVFLFQAVL